MPEDEAHRPDGDWRRDRRRGAGDISTQLRRHRERLRMGIFQAADRIGVSVHDLSSWEDGKRAPLIADVGKIAAGYDLSSRDRQDLVDAYNATPHVEIDEPWNSFEDRVNYALHGPTTRPVATSDRPANYKQDGSVFISYRRTDDPGFAGRLYDRLAWKLGSEKLFMDVDEIEIGLDFVNQLDEALNKCVVLIAVIGPRWLSATDTSGQRRLDNPNDIVRREIEQALDRDIRIIPILVDGTEMPQEQDLPISLAPLARRHAHMMTHAHFGSSILELISTIERILAG